MRQPEPRADRGERHPPQRPPAGRLPQRSGDVQQARSVPLRVAGDFGIPVSAGRTRTRAQEPLHRRRAGHPDRLEQCRGSSDVRRGHAGALEPAVHALAGGGIDGLLQHATLLARGLVPARSGDPYLGAVRGVGSETPFRAYRADGQRPRISGWIRHPPAAAVPRGADHHASAGARVHDGIRHRCRAGPAAQRQVEHTRAVICRPADRIGDGDRSSTSVGAQHLERQEARERRHPRHADGVSRGLRDRAGDVRPVAVIVASVVPAGEEVVAGQQARGIQIVDRRDPGVDDGDRHARPARGIPGGGRSSGLEMPLLGKLRVVRHPE